MQKEITSQKEEDTISLGSQMAPLFQRGDVIVLTGDLGARKNQIGEPVFFVFLEKKMKLLALLLPSSTSIN